MLADDRARASSVCGRSNRSDRRIECGRAAVARRAVQVADEIVGFSIDDPEETGGVHRAEQSIHVPVGVISSDDRVDQSVAEAAIPFAVEVQSGRLILGDAEARDDSRG